METRARRLPAQAEYNRSISDGVISVNEAKRMLRETVALQQVLLDIKLHLERESR